MNKTRKKIILAAISIFNEQGLANVRNQDIAEAADISLSNYNYHFNTKKDLVLAVIDYMQDFLQSEVYGSNALLTRDGQGLRIAQSYFEFEKKFRFFYLDTNNIIQTYPELKPALEQQIKEAIQMIKNINYLSIGKGLLKPPPADMPDLYEQLARQIWINNHFWFAQMQISGQQGDVVREGMKANFLITYPYLTEAGKERFKTFIEAIKNDSY